LKEVFVLSKSGKPLMPTWSVVARLLLKEDKAKVVKRKPFTIQLLYDSKEYTQDVSCGIDSGYEYIGFSCVSKKEELISGEVRVDSNTKRRLDDRRMYRVHRRGKLRHREPRFNNRRRKEGWLPPSVERRTRTHFRVIEKLKDFLPISKTIVELGNFDIQKLENPDIEGTGYQQGDLYGYQNIKEYVLAREKSRCQLCSKLYRKSDPWKLHHIIPRSKGGTDRPKNRALLHVSCHDKLHKQHLEHRLKKARQYKESSFMNIIRSIFTKWYPEIERTYGYLTKVNRVNLGLEKSHINDAFVIASGTKQTRSKPFSVIQRRKNNRRLQIQRRDGINIRKQRYFHQPKDLIKLVDSIYEVWHGGSSVGLKDSTGRGFDRVVGKLDSWIFHSRTLVWV